MTTVAPHGPRVCALVGPYLSGKTTLLESLLTATGALHRTGTVRDGTTLGDSSAEARARQMSVEATLASCDYLDQNWTFIDCPGSIEFAQETRDAVLAADVAVVVVEPEPARAITAAPVLKYLDRNKIPHLIFINKTDHGVALREMVAALQTASDRPLVLREIPIRDGDKVTGFVDLVSERAYEYLDGAPSKLIKLPDSVAEREQEARDEMLEALADFDDKLLEDILEDSNVPTGEVYDNLTKDLADDLVVPVFFGSAQERHGIVRLLKALRHEAPDVDACAHRLGLDPEAEATQLQIFKTQHLPHAGKFSIARVISGEAKDGAAYGGQRNAGIYRLFGDKHEKISSAAKGSVIGIARMEPVKTGAVLTESGEEDSLWPDAVSPVFARAISIDRHADEVKLGEALKKLGEEDRSLTARHNPLTGEFLLNGQGDIHLQVAKDRLASRYNLTVTMDPPQTAYQESIRKGTTVHGRYKKQTGGHGQFGDVHLEINPLPRGDGFAFTDRIVGGVVPKQYIPAVGKGVEAYLKRGPLGFPVVDVSVVLTDGSYHSVDSSDQAFQMAARVAMTDGMRDCGPVLLEPISLVTISIPSDYTPKAQRLISGRRGQILGFDTKEAWDGWDEVTAHMPDAEITDMITELRSLSQGVGFYTTDFVHMQELQGKQADQIVAARTEK